MAQGTTRSDQGVGSLGDISPGGTEGLDVTVVTGKSVDSGLDTNESELSISVGTVSLQMLSDVDGLLDEVVEILGEGGGHAVFLQYS